MAVKGSKYNKFFYTFPGPGPGPAISLEKLTTDKDVLSVIYFTLFFLHDMCMPTAWTSLIHPDPM